MAHTTVRSCCTCQPQAHPAANSTDSGDDGDRLQAHCQEGPQVKDDEDQTMQDKGDVLVPC